MRVKRYDVSVAFLKTLLGPGRRDWEVEEGAIPRDAELIRTFTYQTKSSVDVISLVFFHPSFPDVPDGAYLEPTKILFREYARPKE